MRHKLACNCYACEARDREFARAAALAVVAGVLILGIIVARSGVVSWLAGWSL